MSDVKEVSAGDFHSLILKKDGSLWTCGNNTYGQLAHIVWSNANCKTPEKVMSDVKTIAASNNHSLILKNDNSIWACGNNRYGQLGDGTTTHCLIPVKAMELSTNTAIGDVAIQREKNRTDNSVYSLSGQRLDTPRKGINIINGKKIIVK